MSALDTGGCDRVGLVGGLRIGVVELVVNFLCSMGSGSLLCGCCLERFGTAVLLLVVGLAEMPGKSQFVPVCSVLLQSLAQE